MKTCKQAMATIMRDSITLRLKILLSVLLTVLKLRFSLVRKYFWLRVMVESWPESLKMDSSRAEVCSGDVPCFDGRLVRSSFSTYILVSPRSCAMSASCQLTAISKSTNFSANVLISLLKQNLYSPASVAEKTKSPWRSFCPSKMSLSCGPTTS